jgi:hypothetical protein
MEHNADLANPVDLEYDWVRKSILLIRQTGYINLQPLLFYVLYDGAGAVGCGMGEFEIAGQLHSIPPKSRPCRRPSHWFELNRNELRIREVNSIQQFHHLPDFA